MKTKWLYFLLVPLLFSCAIHSGSISSNLLDNNTIYEDHASGATKTKYYLGLGGLSHNHMIESAKKVLYKNRPLKEGESYANFTVDIKRAYYLIFSEHTVTVSADIVKTQNNSSSIRFSDGYLKSLDDENTEDESTKNRYSERYLKSLKNDYENLFQIGTQVMDYNFNKGNIIQFKSPREVIIRYNDGKEKKESIRSIYTLRGKNKGIKVGEEHSSKNVKGKVIAVGINRFIVYDGSNYHRLYYN